MGILDPQYDSSRPQDEQAVERYRYLLRTAPPEDLERVHGEAFAKLSPQQRQLVFRALSRELPESERARLTNEPSSLARAATRAELRQPGTLERALTPAGGGMFSNLFSSLAGAFIGSAIAHSLFGGLVAPPANDDAVAANDDADADADTGADGDLDNGGFDFDT